MRFAIDSWSPEYGVAADSELFDTTEEPVDVAVEVAPESWAPIGPSPSSTPAVVVFVDGVRRIEARVWITDDEGRVHAGVCASVAAGAVHCVPGNATVTDVAVRRGVFASAAAGAGPIITRHGTYELYPTVGETPENLYKGIHDTMTSLESQVAASDDADLIVFDGPLRGRTDGRGVGSVKTHAVQYLPDDLQTVVGRLASGERTPLFLIGGRFTRWSWYLRLPGPVSQPWSGVIRCELPGIGSTEGAVERVDQVSSLLPRFASEPHKDPRAPQNLYPIAGLEHTLRRRLGDQLVLERGLRVAAHNAASVVERRGPATR